MTALSILKGFWDLSPQSFIDNVKIEILVNKNWPHVHTAFKEWHGERLVNYSLHSQTSNYYVQLGHWVTIWLECEDVICEDVKKLFVALIKPHKAVLAQTMARWLQDLLINAGIGTSVLGQLYMWSTLANSQRSQK